MNTNTLSARSVSTAIMCAAQYLANDGSLLICNWLGHGTDLGGTGYPLLEFSPDGALVGGWQDATRTSSLQTFALLN